MEIKSEFYSTNKIYNFVCRLIFLIQNSERKQSPKRLPNRVYNLVLKNILVELHCITTETITTACSYLKDITEYWFYNNYSHWGTFIPKRHSPVASASLTSEKIVFMPIFFPVPTTPTTSYRSVCTRNAFWRHLRSDCLLLFSKSN